MTGSNPLAIPAGAYGAELELYRRYLDALSRTSLLLLENTSEQNWAEVLQLLVEVTDVSQCCLFLNDFNTQHQAIAKLISTWSTAGTSSPVLHADFREIIYREYPTLSDRLHVGMVYSASLRELPIAERTLFEPAGIGSILCIPILVRGEMAGFLGLFCEARQRDWQAGEVNLLCTIANDFSLALVRRHAEQDLKASEARLRMLVGATEDVVIEYDEHYAIHNIWTENTAFLGLLPGEPRGRSLAALPRELGQGMMLATSQVLLSGVSHHAEFTLPSANEPRHYLGRFQVLPPQADAPRRIVALLRDVTQIRQEESQRKVMLDTLNLLDEAIIDLDPQGNLVSASSAWIRLCGAALTNRSYFGPLLQYVQSDDHAVLLNAFSTLASGEKRLATLRFRMLQEGADQIWIEGRLLAIPDASGRIISLRGILRDITAIHLQERRITQLALHDALTQLPNRILLEEHLHQAIARAERNNGKVALGFIDLDHFKQINDTLGHKAGDTVLVTLARRLSSTLREVDTLSRWGGDEFVVLLTDSQHQNDFRAIAERLRDAARQSIDIDGVETKLTISIGFAVYPDDAEDAETLMSLADHTMFHAKSIGRNNAQFYQDIEGATLRRENVLLQSRLSNAITTGELQFFYQPVVDARSGRIVALEALARWHDEQDGWISPDTFIPMAEHLGMIHELGMQVFDHALERLRAWCRNGHAVKAAINISRAQFFAPNFLATLLGKLKQFGLAPQDIILEITESVALLDVSYESKRLHELAEAGFTLAIDDFGTGYSGLAQLHQMPISQLKVDASFTARLDTESGRRIVQAIVQMAKALKLETIVEGVETRDNVAYLASLGVEQMQGRHFGDAMPAGVVDMLLKQQAEEIASS